MLHGFTQTGACLGPLATGLGEGHEVMAPDLPGHGRSGAPAQLDCPATAQHLVDTLCPPHDLDAHWIGYSLGARIALHVALDHPRSVRSLVLIGATAGITDPVAREQRRILDHRRASDLERLGVEEFTRRWLEMEMFSGLPETARFVRQRLENTSGGLAGSLRNAGTGSMEPLWERLGELAMPVLLLSGQRDHAFTEQAAAMARKIGDNATARTIPGAGHAAHLEAPGVTLELVEAHLDACR